MPQKPIDPISPPPLRPGDSIGIIAPGSPLDKSKFFNGISTLDQMGFRPIFSEELFSANGYLAGPDILRANLLSAAFLDKEIKAVWCGRGGYGSLRILKYIDFKLIQAHPKIFIGSSDISVLLNTLYFKSGLVTFHGPMIESLGNADKLTLKSIRDIFFLTDHMLTVNPGKSIVIHPGRATGIVSGGNLATICHLVGTPFQPNYSGHILLLEDIGEAPYRIDRMLTQMKMAQCFDGISGLILGSFEKSGEIDHIYNIFYDIFRDIDIPILAGFDIGHGYPNITIPFGIKALLDTDAGVLVYQHQHLNPATSLK